MDRAKQRHLEQRFAEADRHVADGERLLQHQREAIEERRRDGHDVKLATALLAEMEETQRLHIAGRDRIRQELAAMRANAAVK
jgi:hypothetical protein